MKIDAKVSIMISEVCGGMSAIAAYLSTDDFAQGVKLLEKAKQIHPHELTTKEEGRRAILDACEWIKQTINNGSR